MRTLQVVNVRFFNATSWYGMYLGQLLNEAGHETLVLTLPGTESHEYAARFGHDPVLLDLNTVNPARLVSLYASMRDLVREFRPDVVNCHRGESFVLWGLLKREFKSFSLVRTRGDQRLPKNNWPNRWLHGSVADAVISTNSRMFRHFRDTMGIRESMLHQVFGGVDTTRFFHDAAGRKRVRDEFGYTDEDMVVGMVGRFDKVKGQYEFIRAVSEAVQAGAKNLKVLFVGFETDTSHTEVERWLNTYGIDGITKITGMRDDVNACINALDIGVSASLFSETIARAPLEIMATGRPLLATTVGVLPDLLSTNALVAPGNYKMLGERIGRVATDKAFRDALVAEQAERMMTLDGQSFLNQTLAVYERCMS